MIFIDRSIPRSVADSLKAVRPSEVLWLEDEFRHDVTDESWLPVAGRRNWLVISRDKKIRTRPRERELVVRSDVGMFIVAQKQNPTRWDYYKIMGACLDEMESLFASTPRPFYTIDSARRFRRFA